MRKRGPDEAYFIIFGLFFVPKCMLFLIFSVFFNQFFALIFLQYALLRFLAQLPHSCRIISKILHNFKKFATLFFLDYFQDTGFFSNKHLCLDYNLCSRAQNEQRWARVVQKWDPTPHFYLFFGIISWF